MDDLLSHFQWDYHTTMELLSADFVQNSLIAVALLGIIAGVVSPFIVMRSMSFAVHGTSELALTGGAFALMVDADIASGAIIGSVIAALVFGLLGDSDKQNDATAGVVLAFGMGLAVLFLHLAPTQNGNRLSLLTGQVAGVSSTSLWTLFFITAFTVLTTTLMFRPLLYTSGDPMMATSRGVHTKAVNLVFCLVVGLAAATAVQQIGVLLVLAILIAPAAAASLVSTSVRMFFALSMVFALVSSVGGLILSLSPGLPISVMITTISFSFYLICWLYKRV